MIADVSACYEADVESARPELGNHATEFTQGATEVLAYGTAVRLG